MALGSKGISIEVKKEYQGSFLQVSRLLLQKIQTNSSGIIKSGTKRFNYLNEEGLTILCLTEDISTEVAFAFLFDLIDEMGNENKKEQVNKENPMNDIDIKHEKFNHFIPGQVE